MGERIIVLGGGVIGLSCALALASRGHDVSILEKGSCGGQASGAAAGMLAPFSENPEYPDGFFRLCLDSLRRYPRWQAEVKRLSGMDFEYTESGSLYAVYHEADLSALSARLSWQRPFGTEADIVEGSRLEQLEPQMQQARAAVYCPEESHVHAPDYVRALKAACCTVGVEIREQLQELALADWTAGVRVQDSAGQSYEADRIVLCTGAWSGSWSELFGFPIPVYPIRGQICAYSAEQAELRHILFTSQGYMVSKANGMLVCGASEDIAGFATSVTDKGIHRLEALSKRTLPFLKERQPTLKWAGLRPATQDGYPLLGSSPEHPRVIFACGHYRNGILLSPATAAVVADIVDGRKPELELDAFRPDRFR
ncbi:glycine oxidase ThiO [Xylanibacillus composti]|nr:glycine oxidase ThiO [Xylanibacillus composti]